MMSQQGLGEHVKIKEEGWTGELSDMCPLPPYVSAFPDSKDIMTALSSMSGR